MPPKAKFTRDEIIKKALDIVRTEGIDRLTSRELGAQLGSSARSKLRGKCEEKF